MTRVYDGSGCDRLRVDDIASATGLAVKVDLNGDYLFTGSNETLTRDTHYWLAPANAALEPEAKPWTHLEIVPDNAVLSIFPAQKRAVQVTAIFGWPAVPGAIREANIMVVRELRDLEEAGFTLDLQNIDQAVQLAPQAFSIVERIKSQYSRTAVIR